MVPSVVRGCFLDTSGDLSHFGTSFGFCHGIRKERHDRVGHVFHPLEESCRKSFVWQLFFKAHGPEAIFQVIIFYGAVRLYLVVPTVMVCKHQALVRNDLSCTEETGGRRTVAQSDYGVLDARVVNAVDLLGSEFQPHLFHFLVVEIFNKHGEPHSLIRVGRGCSFQIDGERSGNE